MRGCCIWAVAAVRNMTAMYFETKEIEIGNLKQGNLEPGN